MILKIRTKPSSKKEGMVFLKPDEYLVMLKEEQTDPEINYSLLRVISEKFLVPKENILLLKGSKARRKIIEILTT